MASISEVLEKVFTLTSNVEGLVKDVERLNDIMRDHHERIVRLEGRDDPIAEKAKNASLEAVIHTHQRVLERIGELEGRINQWERPSVGGSGSTPGRIEGSSSED